MAILTITEADRALAAIREIEAGKITVGRVRM